MKVKDLIYQLLEYPMDFELLVSKDQEGNGFNKLETIQPEMIDDDGDILCEDTCINEDIPYVLNAVVIWP